eukprot:3866597-Amphidinium_carterae.1
MCADVTPWLWCLIAKASQEHDTVRLETLCCHAFMCVRFELLDVFYAAQFKRWAVDKLQALVKASIAFQSMPNALLQQAKFLKALVWVKKLLTRGFKRY